jgi:hypothetical protein
MAKTARDAETTGILADISDHILLYEFAEAARLLDNLMNGGEV